MTMFKDFLNSLLPVAEELGEKEAALIVRPVEKDGRLEVQLVTRFANGKAVREVTIDVPEAP